MTVRIPKDRMILRLGALVGVALWLLAVSYCSLEPVLEFGHVEGRHDHPCNLTAESHSEGGEGASHNDGHTAQTNREERGGHDSHNHSDHQTICCSTLNATAQTGYEIVLAELVLHPSAFPDAELRTALLALEQRQPSPNRHARPRDVVLTPVVCTEPANPSHGPPVFI